MLVGGSYVLRYLEIGRWTLPTTAEFAEVALKHQDLVRAIYDYKAEHGVLPEELKDLIPGYLPSVPDAPLFFNGASLRIPTNLFRTDVYYRFGDEEGWYVGGEYGNGPLPAPNPSPTRPALTGDALIVARLTEYDRRIALDRGEMTYHVCRNYTQKIAYLLSLDRKSDALSACRAAANAFPDWWRPRMVAAMLAGKDSGAQPEQMFRTWVEQHPTFIHYWHLCYYYRSRDRHDDAVAALREAVKHSLADADLDGGWVPDAYAFNAAAYACERRQPELVLEITWLWEKPRGVYNYHNENLNVFRAAAELTLGEFDEAAADLNRVPKLGCRWAGNIEQLCRAVTAKDRAFVYDPGRCCCSDWTLLPRPE